MKRGTPAAAARQGAQGEHRPWRAAGALLAGIVCVASMDAAGKVLSQSLPVLQINWARFFFHFLVVTPFVLMMSPRRTLAAQRPHLPLHVLRGLMLAASSFCFFFAISTNPVPDAIAIFFVEPLIVMLLARWFIGERLDGRLIVAALCGLAGVLVVLRPGLGVSGYDWRIWFALGASVFFAGYIVSARHVAGSSSAFITSWTTAVFGLLPMLLIAPFVWEMPSAREWGLMALVGALSGAGHTLIILSVRYAAAGYVAALHYAEVPVAALIAYVVFSHVPDGAVWAGVMIIACANFYALRGRG